MTATLTKQDNTSVPQKGDDDGRTVVTADVGAPIPITAPTAIPVEMESVDGIAQTQTVANSRAGTAASQSVKLPEKNGKYVLQARGEDVFIETADGSAPSVTASAGGYSLMVMDGQTIVLNLAGDYIAWCTAVDGGVFVLCHVET